jgi:hypothetical protein
MTRPPMSCGHFQIGSIKAAFSIDLNIHGEEDGDMFFTIFWTTYVPVAIVILSLVGDWLRHSFQEVRTPAWLTCRIGGGSSEGQRQNWACRCER